jgi:hypothetical protein
MYNRIILTWTDQIPERQSQILQKIYESVAHYVSLHQQSTIDSTKAVANPHKDDLDNLTDVEDQAEVRNEIRSEVRDNAQVENLAQERVNILPYLNL